MMPQQEPQTAGLPDMQEYKKQQTGILATMIPQIMNAMGGGDPYVQRALQQQQQQYEQRIMQNNLRGFMRSVAMPGTGDITPELIMEQAQAWDVPADMAMQAIMQFQAFRKANQAEKQKFSRVLPNGAVNTFEALPTDPNVQGEGIFPGEISNMPGPPALTETYNPDGTATIVPKVAGATIRPQPKTRAVNTGDAVRIVEDKPGQTFRVKESPEKARSEAESLRKEMTQIQGKIHALKTKDGLAQMIAQNPAFGVELQKMFNTKDMELAGERYLTHLENRLAELQRIAGKDYGGKLKDNGLKPTHEFIPGQGLKELQ